MYCAWSSGDAMLKQMRSNGDEIYVVPIILQPNAAVNLPYAVL